MKEDGELGVSGKGSISVRANPEFGSIPIKAEVSGRWTSKFGSFRTLSPFGKRMLQRVDILNVLENLYRWVR